MKSVAYINHHYPQLAQCHKPRDITLQKLVAFFENPIINSFTLGDLNEYLSDDDLLHALQAIVYYYSDDYSLTAHRTYYSTLIEGAHYVSQTTAAALLRSYGLPKMTQQMIASYIYRNTFPMCDLIIDNKKFWRKETIYNYYLSRLKT